MRIMKTRKAQAAMEYLMTYGWAILIVIIVAAALFALGVFNPSTWTGKQATGFANLGVPADWDLASDGAFKIVLQNTKSSETVTIHSVTATLGATPPIPWNASNLQIGPGGSIDLSTLPGYSIDLGSPASGSSYTVEVAIEYVKGSSTYSSVDTGRVTGVVK